MKKNVSKPNALNWNKVEGSKFNSLESLSRLLPEGYVASGKKDHFTKGYFPVATPKKKVSAGEYHKPDYRPFQRNIIKPNLDAAGNYGKLIYNRPKS